MEILKSFEGNKLVIIVKGRLNTITAPDLENELGDLNNINELIFDLKELEYISSAGLRVLLKAQKMIDANNGNMKVINVNNDVNEVFEITGFQDVLNIEKL